MTVAEAMKKGKPVVGIASNLDQHLSMEAVLKSGVGKKMRADKFNVHDFQKTVTALLSDQILKRRCQQVATTLASADPGREFDRLVREHLKLKDQNM